MRAITLVVAGLVLLVTLCFIARLFRGDDGVSRIATVFIGLWFIIMAIDFSAGMTNVGYMLTEQIVFFLAAFGVPALVALVISRRFRY